MIPVSELRPQFPALNRQIEGKTPIYLDGPGGTQVPQRVLDAMVHYLTTCSATHGGSFPTSRESDEILLHAHQAMADLLNAPSHEEIVFGLNMTTLTFHISRSLAKEWKEDDEVIVTRLDHDANVRPWALAAADAGATLRFVDFHREDGTLDMEDLRSKLNERTRLVAIGAASNLLGTINDVETISQWAHEVGALTYVDAVHFAPHGLIDVQKWGCDFLACSAYKFFGPHVGILWGRREHLERLTPYKVRPAGNQIPDRWMTGTQNHEGIAGTLEAVNYLASITSSDDRRPSLKASMEAIHAYELDLSRRLLEGLAERPSFRVWGLSDLSRLAERVPTISVTHDRHSPLEMERHLASHQIFAWAGNMYALEVTEHLGIEEEGGALRLGLVHYNTAEEIDALLRALDQLS